MAQLSSTDLDVSALCLGGNVFGWTADEAQTITVLDAYAAAGGNFIDTADSYSAWVPGNTGGESEALIGRWLATRSDRDSLVIATKVGHDRNLRRQAILDAAERSLKRLGTDHIDLYYAHNDDPDTPIEETLGAFGELIAAGKVRHIGASNFTPARLQEALDVAQREGLPRYVALQTEFNLVSRDYEHGLMPLVAARGLASIPYLGLAGGFLTGKYRPGGPPVASPRARGATARLDEHGVGALDTLGEIAAAHDTTHAAVALAWLAAQPTVLAPLASARTVEQLEQLLTFTTLTLTAGELDALSLAGLRGPGAGRA